MSNVFEYLFPCDAVSGDTIIKQGDEGDNFYIIEQVTQEFIKKSKSVTIFSRAVLIYLWMK